MVGTETEQQRLLVHHSQLENASPVFKAAFKESWKEGQEAQITLPDDEPVTVKTYLHFIYTGKIACQTPDPVFTVPDSNRHLAEYIILAKLYCFGEKYQDVRLKNAIVNAIITKASVERFSPVGPSVDIIYKGTCAGSPARRPMIDMHIRYVSDRRELSPSFELACRHRQHAALSDTFSLGSRYTLIRLKDTQPRLTFLYVSNLITATASTLLCLTRPSEFEIVTKLFSRLIAGLAMNIG